MLLPRSIPTYLLKLRVGQSHQSNYSETEEVLVMKAMKFEPSEKENKDKKEADAYRLKTVFH